MKNATFSALPCVCVCVCVCVCACAQLCLTLCDPVDYIARLAPLSMEFPRQEYWSGLLFPTPVMYVCVCVCVCVCVYNINLYHKYINIIYFDRKGLHGTVD